MSQNLGSFTPPLSHSVTLRRPPPPPLNVRRNLWMPPYSIICTDWVFLSFVVALSAMSSVKAPTLFYPLFSEASPIVFMFLFAIQINFVIGHYLVCIHNRGWNEEYSILIHLELKFILTTMFFFLIYHLAKQSLS